MRLRFKVGTLGTSAIYIIYSSKRLNYPSPCLIPFTALGLGTKPSLHSFSSVSWLSSLLRNCTHIALVELIQTSSGLQHFSLECESIVMIFISYMLKLRRENVHASNETS